MGDRSSTLRRRLLVRTVARSATSGAHAPALPLCADRQLQLLPSSPGVGLDPAVPPTAGAVPPSPLMPPVAVAKPPDARPPVALPPPATPPDAAPPVGLPPDAPPTPPLPLPPVALLPPVQVTYTVRVSVLR